MATQYPYNSRSSRPSDGYSRPTSSAQPGISRSSRSGGYSGRPASGQRSGGYNGRPSGQRSGGYNGRPAGQRSAGQRPSGGQYNGRRPASGNGRRPQRRKPKGRFFAFIAAAVVLAVALILILGNHSRPKDVPVAPVQAPVTAGTETEPIDTAADPVQPETADAQQSSSTYEEISSMLDDTENHVEGLSADQMVIVEGLSVNQSLPTEWLNVLLLGTDERTLSDSARTDAMMICSINRNTGEVKLTSIMRDLAVELKDIGKFSGTYGINAANYFGGPKLAIRTVNELFDMNIQNYVMVNFFGFQKIAQALGGVDVDVSEREKDLINERIVEQYKFAVLAGVDESDLTNQFLETYGPNTHLDGRQALAYARLRKLDGGDYMRVQRQQIVLDKLTQKVKTLNPLQITQLGAEMIGQVKTNMELNDIIQIAITVASNGLPSLKTFRLPVANTYKEERREKGGSKLWDCDFAANAIKLYDFIYE